MSIKNTSFPFWRLIDGGLWLGYAMLIFLLSAQAKLPSTLFVVTNIDKLYHALAYAIFAVLAARFFAHFQARKSWTFLMTWAVTALYGVSDEWHQSFVPGRDASLGDWVADLCGGLVGASLWLMVMSVRRQMGTKV
ncbi:MAG: VanZ family protein [Myxococcota bacterium]